jgi:polysaccharide export outer membrane protein
LALRHSRLLQFYHRFGNAISISRPISAISRLWPLIVCGILLQGCGANSIDLPPPPAERPVYRLASGDKVSVQVFGQPDQSGQFEVNADGNLSFPLLGTVPARDKTVAELTEDLRARLDRFIVNPRFTVDVMTYRSVFVLGEVKNPGAYPYGVGITVRQAVALAGGFSYRALTDKVVLTRTVEGSQQEYGAVPGDLLLPGDTIEVRQRVF